VLDVAALDRVRGHPRFGVALDEMARLTVAMHRNQPLLNRLINDRGRLLMAAMALHLHFEEDGPGLTSARLQGLCVEQGVASPGRAAATIALMRWGGFLQPAPAPDRRMTRLAPTSAFLTSHRERLRNGLETLAVLWPEAQAVADRLDSPAMYQAMAQAQASRFLAGFRFGQACPELMPLLDRNAGLVILFDLLVREGETNASALARRYGVSRAHAADLLRAFTQEGEIRPAIRRDLERVVATVFLFNLGCAREALAKAWQPTSGGDHLVHFGHQFAEVNGL
jgi:hypothetical protein